MRYLLSAVTLVFLLYTPALSDGKITADPNQSPAAAAENEAAVDKRLAQNVTYEVKKKSALAVLTDLGEQTGVAFRAGKNNQDWQVRDRKLNIFAKDVPLGKLMSSIARALHCKWSISDFEKTTVYRLVIDKQAMSEAEAARLEYEKKQMERRQKAMDMLAKTSGLSEEDMAKLKQENPFLYYCAQSGITDSMNTLCKESPDMLNALMNGQAMDINAANMSPTAQRSLVGLVAGMGGLEKKFGGHSHTDTSGLAAGVGGATIRINSHIDEMRSSPRGNPFLGMIEITYPDSNGSQEHAGFPLFDPESNITKALGKIMARCEEEGCTVEELGEEFGGEMSKADEADRKASEEIDKPIEHPDDPDLAKKIKIEDYNIPFEDFLGKVAEASGFAIVADSFKLPKQLQINAEKEIDLKAVLGLIDTVYKYDWDKHGTVIELWDKKWADKVAAMVPDAWLERWRKNLKENGTLDIGELAEIASLTPEQLAQNLTGDSMLSSSAQAARSNRDVLKLYAGLSDTQKEMLFAQSGLDLRSVGEELWPMIEKTIGSKNSAFLTNPDAHITAFCARESQEKSIIYRFRIKSSEDLPEIAWDVLTPTYIPPEKTAAK